MNMSCEPTCSDHALTSPSDDELLAGGIFSIMGGHVSARFARRLCSACPMDFDRDGFVTGLDFDRFVQAFDDGRQDADYDEDGFVTTADLDLFVEAFNTGC